VIAGHKAMYKGVGTINGQGAYGFLISAVDAALTPSTDVDMFRIKIWDVEDEDTLVYDNQMEADDDAEPTTDFHIAFAANLWYNGPTGKSILLPVVCPVRNDEERRNPTSDQQPTLTSRCLLSADRLFVSPWTLAEPTHR
jgi:hypothetical protein